MFFSRGKGGEEKGIGLLFGVGGVIFWVLGRGEHLEGSKREVCVFCCREILEVGRQPKTLLYQHPPCQVSSRGLGRAPKQVSLGDLGRHWKSRH